MIYFDLDIGPFSFSTTEDYTTNEDAMRLNVSYNDWPVEIQRWTVDPTPTEIQTAAINWLRTNCAAWLAQADTLEK